MLLDTNFNWFLAHIQLNNLYKINERLVLQFPRNFISFSLPHIETSHNAYFCTIHKFFKSFFFNDDIYAFYPRIPYYYF